MLIKRNKYLDLRKNFFFLAIFSSLLLSLLLSSEIHSASSLEDIKRSAEHGDAEAQFILGRMYADGEGVLENDATAFSWYLKAAEQGHAGAQINLGVIYGNYILDYANLK